MTPIDLLVGWVLLKLFGMGSKQPKWPGPGATGPTGPTGPGATGPTGPTGPGATGPTGPGATGPAGGTTWKPYFYIQPDAGAKYGTPYGLAAEWHGQGSAWTDIYNFTQDRPLSGASAKAIGVRDKALVYNWTLGPATQGDYKINAMVVPVYLSSADEVWIEPDWQSKVDYAATHIYAPGHLDNVIKGIAAKLRAAKAGGAKFGTVVSGTETTPAYANVGDKLLIPWTWPEPKAPEIQARLEPIPAGTSLPGVAEKGVSGDEDTLTI